MKLDLAEPQETQALPPEEVAVRCQDLITDYRLKIELLEAKRDEAIAQALANGVRVYGGYRFGTKTPSATLSEKKLATQYGEIADGFITWYQETHAPRLSAVELKRYLKSIDHVNPDQVIADISEPGKGAETVTITKLREAGE